MSIWFQATYGKMIRQSTDKSESGVVSGGRGIISCKGFCRRSDDDIYARETKGDVHKIPTIGICNTVFDEHDYLLGSGDAKAICGASNC